MHPSRKLQMCINSTFLLQKFGDVNDDVAQIRIEISNYGDAFQFEPLKGSQRVPFYGCFENKTLRGSVL